MNRFGRFARVNYVCGNNACGNPPLPYPRHLFDSPEDIAYFHCADRSPLWRATTQLAKVWVGVSLRSDTLHVKPHPLNNTTDPDRLVCAPGHLIK